MDWMTETDVQCPACGEWFAVEIDTSQGEEFETIQDCEVCCRPMSLLARCRPGEVLDVQTEAA